MQPKEDEGNKAVQAEIDARRNAPKKTIALQDCLDEYRKEETLGDDNSWYCPRCKEHRPTKKKLDIWTVPEVCLPGLVHVMALEVLTSFAVSRSLSFTSKGSPMQGGVIVA